MARNAPTQRDWRPLTFVLVVLLLIASWRYLHWYRQRLAAPKSYPAVYGRFGNEYGIMRLQGDGAWSQTFYLNQGSGENIKFVPLNETFTGEILVNNKTVLPMELELDGTADKPIEVPVSAIAFRSVNGRTVDLAYCIYRGHLPQDWQWRARRPAN